MPRRLTMTRFLLALLLPALAQAAIWPDAIGAYHRTAASKPVLADGSLWDEYGLQDSETAAYENGSARFTATAWRLQDSTGALAAYDWQRPARSEPSKLAALAAETADSLVLVHGNYLLSFSGYKPTTPELDPIVGSLRNVDTTALPALPGYLPSRDLVPGSERYITGPVSLRKFNPGIPPSAAAFHLGAEAQLGVFQGPKGEMALTIFSYPTPQIAMQQAASLGKIPGAGVKRSGPLVAVILSPPDPDAAESLLAQVRYRAEVTLDAHVPTLRDNIGNLVITAFVLTGILLAFCLVSGLAVGGFRAFLRHFRKGVEPESVITLHLERH
jgi:hypothetical protein